MTTSLIDDLGKIPLSRLQCYIYTYLSLAARKDGPFLFWHMPQSFHSPITLIAPYMFMTIFILVANYQLHIIYHQNTLFLSNQGICPLYL